MAKPRKTWGFSRGWFSALTPLSTNLGGLSNEANDDSRFVFRSKGKKEEYASLFLSFQVQLRLFAAFACEKLGICVSRKWRKETTFCCTNLFTVRVTFLLLPSPSVNFIDQTRIDPDTQYNTRKKEKKKPEKQIWLMSVMTFDAVCHFNYSHFVSKKSAIEAKVDSLNWVNRCINRLNGLLCFWGWKKN